MTDSTDPFDHEEYAELLEAVRNQSAQKALLFRLMYQTGIRVSEVSNLSSEDV